MSREEGRSPESIAVQRIRSTAERVRSLCEGLLGVVRAKHQVVGCELFWSTQEWRGKRKRGTGRIHVPSKGHHNTATTIDVCFNAPFTVSLGDGRH